MGQKAVRKCLQQEIYNYVNSNAIKKCDGMKKFAANWNIKCYKEPDPQNKAVSWYRIRND